MKRVFSLIPYATVLLLLLSCSKGETPNLPEIEPGRFDGDIGRNGYYNYSNDKWRDRMKTTHFDGINYQFHFDADYGLSKWNGITHGVIEKLTINLSNALNTRKYVSFGTYMGIKNYSDNWVSLDKFEQWGDKKTTTFYSTLKEKQSIEADILSVDYIELKVPSLKGKIKGYLYNIENKEDSILINMAFTTQASY